MTDSNRSPNKMNGLRISEWRDAPREDMDFYNVNLSVHKYLYPRYSLQKIQKEDQLYRGVKYRRCTIAHAGEEMFKRDRWNYNLNNSITKWKKPNVHNFVVYKSSPLHKKIPSPMKSKFERMRLSVNESINKSKALRKEIDKNLRTTSYDTYRDKKGYTRSEHLLNQSQKAKIPDLMKLPLPKKMHPREHSENIKYLKELQFQAAKERRLTNNLDTTLYSSTQGNTLNYSSLNVNTTNNTSGNGSGYDITKNYSNSTVFDEEELKRVISQDRNSTKANKEGHLKRRHSTNFVGSADPLSQSDIYGIDRKRFKSGVLNQSDTHCINASRRHSDLLGYNKSDLPSNSYFEEPCRKDTEQTMSQRVKQRVRNETNVSGKLPFATDEYSYKPQYRSRKENYNTAPYFSRENNKHNYFFTKQFYEDLICCVNDRKMIEVICNLRDDDKQVISKTMYKKIQEASANKELTTPAYFYFLYRHIGDVVDDKDYKKQQAQERSHYGYLDTPYTIAKEVMNVQPCSVSDDIDDTDEYEEVELQILENHYYMKNRKELLHPLLARDPNVPSDSSLLRSNKVCKVADLPQDKKKEYLQIVQDMQRQKKESFRNSILDQPDESRILDDAITLNEGFLISHNLFNIHFAPTFGPVVYLLKAQDDKYIYRALEVSSEYVKKIRKIVETRVSDFKKTKAHMTKKDMVKCTLLTCSDVRRVLRVPMSDGWEHYGYFRNQYNVLFFRRPLGSDIRNCK